jgi:hypothetical protein
MMGHRCQEKKKTTNTFMNLDVAGNLTGGKDKRMIGLSSTTVSVGGGRSMEIHEKRKIAVVVRDWFCFGVGKVGNEMKLGSNCCVGVVNASESVSMIRCLKMKNTP